MTDDHEEYKKGLEEVVRRKQRDDYNEVARAVLRRVKDAPAAVVELIDRDPALFYSAFDREVAERTLELSRTRPDAFRREIGNKEGPPPVPKVKPPTGPSPVPGKKLLDRVGAGGEDGLLAAAVYLEKHGGVKK